MQFLVRDLLSQASVVPAGSSMNDALAVLLREGVGQIYVTAADGQLLGAATDYDLLKYQMNPLMDDEPVENAACRNIAAVSPDMPVMEIAPLFREGRHRRMAVVEDGRLLGEIGRRDVMRLLLALRETDLKVASEAVRSSGEETGTSIRGPRYAERRRTSVTRSELGQP